MAGAPVCSGPLARGPLRGVIEATGTNAGYARHQVAGDLPACEPCITAKRERLREEYRRNPEKVRRRRRESSRRQVRERPEEVRRKQRREKLRKYGMTPESYKDLLDAQGGVCAICGTDEPGPTSKNFDVDHDHSCCPGEKSCGACVRGLLCRRCNTGLGWFNDDADALLEAGAYLKKGAHRG